MSVKQPVRGGQVRIFVPMRTTLWLLLALLLLNCTDEVDILPGNEPPVVNNVSTLRIENYVNRVFVDLLGREPLDAELATETAVLRRAGLVPAAREALVVKLQTSTDFIEGDTSYRRAHYQHLYNLTKIRCLEGIADATIRSEFLGAATDPDAIARLEALLALRADWQAGVLTPHEALARTIHNDVYDRINMNTTNFVEASFDNLLWRFPTQSEFRAGFDMVEFNAPETLFGGTGSSKTDYVQLLTNDPEMSEGLLIWVYQLTLARRPTTTETAALLDEFHQNRDLERLYRAVLITDEYAGF